MYIWSIQCFELHTCQLSFLATARAAEKHRNMSGTLKKHTQMMSESETHNLAIAQMLHAWMIYLHEKVKMATFKRKWWLGKYSHPKRSI